MGAAFLISRSEDDVGSDGRKGSISSSRCCGVNCLPWYVPRRKAPSCAGVIPVARAIAASFGGKKKSKWVSMCLEKKGSNKRVTVTEEAADAGELVGRNAC